MKEDINMNDLNLENVVGGLGDSARRAIIDRGQCVECGTCISYCPLGAIGPDFEVGPECDGCGVCEAACPLQCIQII